MATGLAAHHIYGDQLAANCAAHQRRAEEPSHDYVGESLKRHRLCRRLWSRFAGRRLGCHTSILGAAGNAGAAGARRTAPAVAASSLAAVTGGRRKGARRIATAGVREEIEDRLTERW